MASLSVASSGSVEQPWALPSYLLVAGGVLAAELDELALEQLVAGSSFAAAAKEWVLRHQFAESPVGSL